jgi:hypothetical protein
LQAEAQFGLKIIGKSHGDFPIKALRFENVMGDRLSDIQFSLFRGRSDSGPKFLVSENFGVTGFNISLAPAGDGNTFSQYALVGFSSDRFQEPCC